MITRILTAAVLIAGIGAGIWLKGWVLRVILLGCMLLSVDEMYRAFKKLGCKPVRWVGYAFCVLATLSQAFSGQIPLLQSLNPAALSLTAGVMLAFAVIVLRGRVDFDALWSTLFPMVYPGLLFTQIFALQDIGTPTEATLALILAFFIASVNDTFALFIGLKFGKHRLSPEISPKKSVEGAVAGLVSSVLFAMLVPAFVTKATGALLPPLWAFALLGLVAGFLSQIGDLAASLIKRHCGIKDFGSIFPGHGGMLDRFDGILFCGAAVYIFFKLAGY